MNLSGEWLEVPPARPGLSEKARGLPGGFADILNPPTGVFMEKAGELLDEGEQLYEKQKSGIRCVAGDYCHHGNMGSCL